MSSPRRRRSTRRRAVVAFGVLAFGLVAVPTALGSAWQRPGSPGGHRADVAGPEPLTAMPADQPAKGLVHRGLRIGPQGTPCAGEFQIIGTDRCTHGPDDAPAGLAVDRPVAPVAARRPEPALPARTTPRPDDGGYLLAGPAGTTTPAAAGAVVCDGDGQTGKRIQVLYVRAADVASRFAAYENSFRTWAAGVDAIYDASAQDTGGRRHVRFVTTADCQVDVREVEVPTGQMDDFSKTISALKTLGFSRTDRKYMIFGESKVYCGIGTFAGDDRQTTNNRSNTGPSYGRNDAGCWTASVAAHELGHNLGAVSNSAPNSSKVGHCVDDYDIMCYKDADETVVKIVCSDRSLENRLDCNHDDYYSTDPKPGSYLASHWNVADNQFLHLGEPSPSPSASATPSAPVSSPAPAPSSPVPSAPSSSAPVSSPAPAPSSPAPSSPAPSSPAPSSPAPSVPAASPSVSASPSATPAPGPTVTGVTSNSVRLSWPPSATGRSYGVVVDDRLAGTVRSTSVSLTGLAPGRTYRVKITVRGADHTGTATVTTPAASVPAAGRRFTLSNALTGDSAEPYGLRSAVRTPVVAMPGGGGAWTLTGGKLTSTATGRCAAPLGRAVAGVPLVQQDCATAPAFTLTRTPAGLVLRTGTLVVGLADTTYAGRPVLALQSPTGTRQQAWSAGSL